MTRDTDKSDCVSRAASSRTEAPVVGESQTAIESQCGQARLRQESRYTHCPGLLLCRWKAGQRCKKPLRVQSEMARCGRSAVEIR